MQVVTDSAERFAADVRAGLRQHADPTYVAGTVAARSPGKPVLGVRIPLLRGAVRTALKCAAGDEATVRVVADRLWHGVAHEEELAACMLLRLAGTRITASTVAQWAPSLDNWLSVDELGGCLGEAITDDPGMLVDLSSLARSESPWQRRLYVVGLIKPVRDGLDPGGLPLLVSVMQDDAKPVRKASAWLLGAVLKVRPSAAPQFLAVWPPGAPRLLTRLLERVPVA
ncbi:DNA alkylation repair protein [Micromonospora sp. NPDC092111]|uniref:DNA alkylation repair protein n=1 Tax=Micromonospora sp. NPDC092111 TaxID=3364289 RepID=UPI0037F8E1D5